MNLGRMVFKYETTGPQITINPNWLIGFIEAEGTFGIKTGSSLYFQVAQKTTSQESLNAITTFLIGLSNLYIPKDSDILPVNVTSATNIKTNVVSIVVSSIDALYYHILPWLDSSNMYSLPPGGGVTTLRTRRGWRLLEIYPIKKKSSLPC